MKHIDKREFFELLTVAELKDVCINMFVAQSGKKAEIIKRLINKTSDDFIDFLINLDLDHYEKLAEYWELDVFVNKSSTKADIFYQLLNYYYDYVE